MRWTWRARPPALDRLLTAGLVIGASVLGAMVWSRPLTTHGTTHILGTPGDNVTFLWNFWWMRFTLAHGSDVLRTDYLFAPFGTDLSLHTLTALPAFLGATVLGGLTTVAAHNVVLVAMLALNAVTCFWLLRDVTHDRVAAGCGALVFAGSPYFAGHLFGHFNLVCAATLPVIALAALRAGAHRVGWTLVLGASLGLTAYLDYYYTLFGVGVAAWLLVTTWGAPRVSLRTRPARPRATRVVLVLAVVLGVVILWIEVTGGAVLTLGTRAVSVRGTFNLRQVFWLCLAVWAWLVLRPSLSLSPRDVDGRRIARTLATAGGVALLMWAPLAFRVASRWMAGDAPPEQPYWQSGPAGVDLGTLVLGNPFGLLTAAWIRPLYASLSIDAIERSGWLGLVPLLLIASALTQRGDRRTAPWASLGALAAVWALGSHLIVFGVNTGLVLPFAVLRYLPGLSNARMPGRAMAIVFLAAAALVALDVAHRRASGWRPARIALLVALIAADFVPAPYPVTSTAVPPIYGEIVARGSGGGLLELPFGVRDGFGERGRLDPTMQWSQSVHERPLAGGFVARLAPSVTDAYAADPVLAPLLTLSEGGDRPDLGDDWARGVPRHLASLGFQWVVARHDAPPRLHALLQNPAFERVAADAERTLFFVRP